MILGLNFCYYLDVNIAILSFFPFKNLRNPIGPGGITSYFSPLNISGSDSVYGAYAMPFSVIIPVINS